MKVVLSGGGTAGHINPALALTEALYRRGHEVYFAGTPAGVEARLVKAVGIPYQGFDVSGFDRSHPVSLVKAMGKLKRATKQAMRWLSEIKPDVVVAFGGYACLPVGRAAKSLRIPVVVHEQNSVMGMANDFLSKSADAVCLTYQAAAKGVANQGRVIVTGNPVRPSVLDATKEEGLAYIGASEDDTVLLVTGGSLGARHLNTAVCAMKGELLQIEGLRVVHITGSKELDTVKADLALTDEEAKRYTVKGYEDHMGEVMAAADLIVSRAGASSLAEITARCIPAVLVPFPYATADHQTMNASECVERGAAVLIKDEEVEGESFRETVLSLLRDPDARAEMRAAAATFETGDAANKLADVIEAVSGIAPASLEAASGEEPGDSGQASAE